MTLFVLCWSRLILAHRASKAPRSSGSAGVKAAIRIASRSVQCSNSTSRSRSSSSRRTMCGDPSPTTGDPSQGPFKRVAQDADEPPKTHRCSGRSRLPVQGTFTNTGPHECGSSSAPAGQQSTKCGESPPPVRHAELIEELPRLSTRRPFIRPLRVAIPQLPLECSEPVGKWPAPDAVEVEPAHQVITLVVCPFACQRLFAHADEVVPPLLPQVLVPPCALIGAAERMRQGVD